MAKNAHHNTIAQINGAQNCHISDTFNNAQKNSAHKDGAKGALNNGAQFLQRKDALNNGAQFSRQTSKNQQIQSAKIMAGKILNEADPCKSEAKKDADPEDILIIKKRLHKAKRTLEDIQKLNIKQWTSLKNSMEKETKTWKKCMVERKLEPQHLGPAFKCDQYGLPRLIPGIKQPVWVHNRRKFLQSLTS